MVTESGSRLYVYTDFAGLYSIWKRSIQQPNLSEVKTWMYHLISRILHIMKVSTRIYNCTDQVKQNIEPSLEQWYSLFYLDTDFFRLLRLWICLMSNIAIPLGTELNCLSRLISWIWYVLLYVWSDDLALIYDLMYTAIIIICLSAKNWSICEIICFVSWCSIFKLCVHGLIRWENQMIIYCFDKNYSVCNIFLW